MADKSWRVKKREKKKWRTNATHTSVFRFMCEANEREGRKKEEENITKS
jgi:hypothetical protein